MADSIKVSQSLLNSGQFLPLDLLQKLDAEGLVSRNPFLIQVNSYGKLWNL